METGNVERRFSLRKARLEPLLPRHYDFVYAILSDDEVAWRWRFGGIVPSPEVAMARMWEGVAVQKLVVNVEIDAPVGLVSLYNHNPRGSTAFLAAVAHPSHFGSGVVVEGAAGLMDYGFARLDLRKIYVEAMEYNLAQFQALKRFAREEARLVHHDRIRGRYWDFVTMAIYRDSWAAIVADPLAAFDGHHHDRAGRNLTYDTFADELAELLGLDDVERPVSRYLGLYDELGLDSLQAVQLLVMIEALAGVGDPPGEPPKLFTFDDAYRYYEELRAALP
jgi:RimJ/RimL family protein N-acetyltransferase/acyl carrier protein